MSSLAAARMPEKRKLFIASSLAERDLQKRYGPILPQFERVLDEREAECIVFDLSDPPEFWTKFVQSIDTIPVSKKATVPCHFSLFSSKHASSFQILQQVRQAFGVEPRLSTTQEGLLAEIKWLQAMAPLRKIPDDSDPIANLLASYFKGR